VTSEGAALRLVVDDAHDLEVIALTGQAPIEYSRPWPSSIPRRRHVLEYRWLVLRDLFVRCHLSLHGLAFSRATRDRCNVTLIFNVKSGEVEGVDVSGVTVAVVADTPKVMSDGNWRLGVVIDAAASDEQAEKLGGVFSGALGGPMGALGPLVGENLGVERLPIEVDEEGLKHSVRIGDEIDFEIEDVVPFGVETGEPAKVTGIFHPAGSELTVSRATRSKINAFGIQYEGKAGFSTSQFSWAA
jgi:hypothetical protein